MKELKEGKKEIMALGILILIEQILIKSMEMVNTMLSFNLRGEEGINVVSAISMINAFGYLSLYLAPWLLVEWS